MVVEHLAAGRADTLDAISLGEKNLAVLDYRNGDAGNIVALELQRHQSIEKCFDIAFGHRTRG